MTRAEFLSRLKQGLIGLPTSAAAEIVSDYETHFADGAGYERAYRLAAEVDLALDLASEGKLLCSAQVLRTDKFKQRCEFGAPVADEPFEDVTCPKCLRILRGERI